MQVLIAARDRAVGDNLMVFVPVYGQHALVPPVCKDCWLGSARVCQYANR